MSANPLAFQITFHDKPAEVVLANLPWKDVVGMAIDPTTTVPDRLAQYRDSNVFWSTATVDGMRATRKRRVALDVEPAVVAAILAKRSEIFIRLRGAGRTYAQCPHCRAGEVEMSLLGLFDTLGVMPPAMISDDFGFFVPPSMRCPARAPRVRTPSSRWPT